MHKSAVQAKKGKVKAGGEANASAKVPARPPGNNSHTYRSYGGLQLKVRSQETQGRPGTPHGRRAVQQVHLQQLTRMRRIRLFAIAKRCGGPTLWDCVLVWWADVRAFGSIWLWCGVVWWLQKQYGVRCTCDLLTIWHCNHKADHEAWLVEHASILSTLPPEALPQTPRHGHHNWTIKIGLASIQVHMKKDRNYVCGVCKCIVCEGSIKHCETLIMYPAPDSIVWMCFR